MNYVMEKLKKLEVEAVKRVDCDLFLNHQLIKSKIKELNNIFGEDNNNINDDNYTLDTIEHKRMKDLENKNKVDYELQKLEVNFKYI